MKLKFFYPVLIVILLISFLALGCNTGRNNDLNRPSAPTNEPVSTENTDNANQGNATDNNGEVAGADNVQLPTKTIKVNNTNVEVEVADTDTAMERGLSGRNQLDDNRGMLFDFQNTDLKKPGIWMKDMLISIDIIWVSSAGKVIGVEANVPLPPEDKDYPVYYPPAEISHVLEVPAGWAAKNNVITGSTVDLGT